MPSSCSLSYSYFGNNFLTPHNVVCTAEQYSHSSPLQQSPIPIYINVQYVVYNYNVYNSSQFTAQRSILQWHYQPLHPVNIDVS